MEEKNKTIEQELAQFILDHPGLEMILYSSYDPYDTIDGRSFYGISMNSIEIGYYYYDSFNKNAKHLILDYEEWVDTNKDEDWFAETHNRLIKCILIDIYRDRSIDYEGWI